MEKRKILPHAVPSWVDSSAIFFVTICCTPRHENHLCTGEIGAAIFEAVEFRQARGDWFAHLVMLMPDHLHALFSFPRDVAMRKTISNFKEIVAKKAGVLWQRDFFDHRLRAEESYEEKARYIRLNPVRQKLVTVPEDWKFVWEPR